jgi:hypothetical protein
MKHLLKLPGVVVTLLALLLTGCGESDSLERTSAPVMGLGSEADQAWAKVLEASRSTSMPAEWQKHPPPRAEFEAFVQKHAERMAAGADLARDFYTRFPNDVKAGEARERERRFLEFAVRAGRTNLSERLDAAARSLPPGANASADEQFRRRAEALRAKAMSAGLTSTESVLKEFETGVRDLQRDFPTRPEVPAMLLLLGQLKGGEAAAALAREVLESKAATPEMHQRASALLLEIENQRKSGTNTAPATRP